MSQQVFQYEHSGGFKLILDARERSTPEVLLDDCYFLGFRLTSQGTIRYHHAWIIANDHQAFLRGLQAEREYLPQGVDEFDLVFMHNLRTRSSDYMSSEIRHEGSTRIGQALSQRNDEHFAVLGVTEDHWVEVLDFKVRDALMAIRMTRSHSKKICGKKLLPLAVCQAHPVTREFDAIFNRESVLIQTLICSATAGSTH
jgi:hypothetical protein